MNTGKLGEEVVAQWLISRGDEILHRRWRSRGGEIDLIAIEPTDTLLFIEVKTRSQRNWDEDGLLAITDRKQTKIISTAILFLSRHPHLAEYPCRFDVAIVRHQPIHQKIVGVPLYILAAERESGLLVEYIPSAFDLS